MGALRSLACLLANQYRMGSPWSPVGVEFGDAVEEINDDDLGAEEEVVPSRYERDDGRGSFFWFFRFLYLEVVSGVGFGEAEDRSDEGGEIVVATGGGARFSLKLRRVDCLPYDGVCFLGGGR